MPSTLPLSAKAVVLHGFSDLARQLTVDDRPLPELKPGQVLVRMAAASINPSDLVFLYRKYGIDKKLPVVPGFEGSGTIVAARAGAYGRWLVGKRVACKAPHDGDGTWAEYMACGTRDCIPLKKHVSLEQGAAFFVNPLTAWCLLEDTVKKGHRAFIQTAAAGAVGRMIARLARRKGVAALNIVRRPEQAELLQKEGARYVFDSSTTEFPDALKKAAHDLRATRALDAVGGPLTATLAAAMPAGSEILIYGALSGAACEMNPADLIFKGTSLSGFWLTQVFKTFGFFAKLSALSQVQNLLASDLATQVQARVPIEKIHDALALYKARRTEGKVLLVFSSAS